MSLSLVQYSDVKFQITNFKSIHSHKTICLLYHVRHQNKKLGIQFFNESDSK